MPTSITVPEQRARLERAGWALTEMVGGPCIVFGFNGDAELCVMGKTRLEAWRKVWTSAKSLALVCPPADGKASA